MLAATGPLHTTRVNQWIHQTRPLNTAQMSNRLQDLSGAYALAGLTDSLVTADELIERVSSAPDDAGAILLDCREHLDELKLTPEAIMAISGIPEAYAALGLPRVDELYAENMASLWRDIRTLTPLLESNPAKACLATDNPGTLYRMATVDSGAHYYASALANYTRAAQLSKDTEDGPQPNQTTKLALALNGLGHIDEAENFLRWSMWQRPHSFVWLKLGILWRNQDKIALSIQALKQAARSSTEPTSLPQTELGISYMRAENWAAAINTLSISVYLDEVRKMLTSTTHMILASAYRLDGQLDNAEVTLTKLIQAQLEANRPEPRAYIELADLQMERGQMDKARATLMTAMMHDLHNGPDDGLWDAAVEQMSPDSSTDGNPVSTLMDRYGGTHRVRKGPIY